MLADDAGVRARAGDVQPVAGDAGILLVADLNVGAALQESQNQVTTVPVIAINRSRRIGDAGRGVPFAAELDENLIFAQAAIILALVKSP